MHHRVMARLHRVGIEQERIEAAGGERGGIGGNHAADIGAPGERIGGDVPGIGGGAEGGENIGRLAWRHAGWSRRGVAVRGGRNAAGRPEQRFLGKVAGHDRKPPQRRRGGAMVNRR